MPSHREPHGEIDKWKKRQGSREVDGERNWAGVLVMVFPGRNGCGGEIIRIS